MQNLSGLEEEFKNSAKCSPELFSVGSTKPDSYSKLVDQSREKSIIKLLEWRTFESYLFNFYQNTRNPLTGVNTKFYSTFIQS